MQVDKLIMGEKRCGREFSGSKGVRTSKNLGSFLEGYFVV